MHKYLQNTLRSVVWFKDVFDRNELEIASSFQRNPVWSVRQKASLIETILLEYPIPELYMQQVTDNDGRQKHIIVDGQQRIRSVIEFLSGNFELDEENSRWAGLTFDDLSHQDRRKIYEYDFLVRLLPEMPDAEIRAIFQRINRNTVALNAQELRHATYWGPFIKLMEDISDYEFWSQSGIFSANDRRRMLDVEFISEIAVAVLNGLQNKKKNLEEFYQLYETSFEEAESLRSLFITVLGEIGQIFPELAKLRWRKKSDFYTLFLEFATHVRQLPLAAEKRKLADTLLTTFAHEVDEYITTEDTSLIPTGQGIKDYARNVERAASDLGSRKERARVLGELLEPVFA
jgi:Protein of unknown function DUF262